MMNAATQSPNVLQGEGACATAKVVVVGFGATGQSVIRYLQGSCAELIAMDTRALPPNKKDLQRRFPKTRLVTGGLDKHSLETADMIVVSPGVSVDELGLEQLNIRAEVIGDIELFARYVAAPVIAITGSNGKSTVASLVDVMLRAAGVNVRLGGNIGTPALDLLDDIPADAYVLELSSFQLETTHSLATVASVILNISEDHLDRHTNLESYIAAKRQIYHCAERVVINRNEQKLGDHPEHVAASFGLDAPIRDADFGLLEQEGERYLAKGTTCLLAVREMRLEGRANWANLLAALALIDAASDALGLSLSGEVLTRVVQAGANYAGLPHRCERVAEFGGVQWINDSKGTNVGASLAAITSFSAPKILIMGGQGKDADFAPLAAAMRASVRSVLLIGEDAEKLGKALTGQVETEQLGTLEAAVARAHVLAQAGDVVLFSPACASFDQFANFMARGDAFRALVMEIAGADKVNQGGAHG